MKELKTMKGLLGAILWLAFVAGASVAHADLIVKINAPKVTGRKAVVNLVMTNTFNVPIESTRATVFLLNSHNKSIGQSTKWMIGGAKNRPALPANKEANYNFVISIPSGASTNLQTKVMFNRIVLEGGRLADTVKEVTIIRSPP